MDIFIYSGFRTFPHTVLELTENQRNMVFAGFEIAKEKNMLPIVLANFPTKKGGG